MALGESKGELLTKYGPYVRSLAAQVRKQFSSQFEMEELVAWGQVGLLEAAERFDARVGANFLTFAHYRIKGAIYDGLRKMGVLKGGAAAQERANTYLTNLSDRHGGGRGDFNQDVSDVSDAVTGLAMIFAGSAEGEDSLHFGGEQLAADERIELEQMRRRVRAAIERLPEKERKLLQGYYFENKTLEEAGAEIGQSKSWASRLHARAVETLKQLLDDEDDNPSDSQRRQDHGRSLSRNSGGSDRSGAAEARGAGQQGRRE